MPAEVAKQLGLSGERLAQSKAGFETEAVGIGHNRLREKAMLTDPALLAERTNAKMRAYADQGKEPDKDVQITQTPSDRATALWRGILWDYLKTRYRDASGNASITNYEGSTRSSELHKLPLSNDQFNKLKFFNWLRKTPMGRELTDFLNDVAAQCNPQAHPSGYRVMSKTEIGAWLIDSDTARDCKSATDGALSLACRMLAGAHAHFAALERQEKLGKKRQN